MPLDKCAYAKHTGAGNIQMQVGGGDIYAIVYRWRDARRPIWQMGPSSINTSVKATCAW